MYVKTSGFQEIGLPESSVKDAISFQNVVVENGDSAENRSRSPSRHHQPVLAGRGFVAPILLLVKIKWSCATIKKQHGRSRHIRL